MKLWITLIVAACTGLGCASTAQKARKENQRLRERQIRLIDDTNRKDQTGALVHRLNNRAISVADLDYRGQLAEIYKDRRTAQENESLRLEYSRTLADQETRNKETEREVMRTLPTTGFPKQ